MSEKLHVMIDIETLGIENCPIIQIAACKFDWTGKIYSTFSKCLDFRQQIDLGLKVDKGTLAWWQSDKARSAIFHSILNQAEEVESVLKAFAKYVAGYERIWSSANFDIPLITSLYKKLKLPVPWQYWKCYDVRTIAYLGNVNPKDDKYASMNTHSALDDCKFQVAYITDAYSNIKEEIICK